MKPITITDMEIVPRCWRCVALGQKPPGVARELGLCRWCQSMGAEDDRLRAEKGMRLP